VDDIAPSFDKHIDQACEPLCQLVLGCVVPLLCTEHILPPCLLATGSQLIRTNIHTLLEAELGPSGSTPGAGPVAPPQQQQPLQQQQQAMGTQGAVPAPRGEAAVGAGDFPWSGPAATPASSGPGSGGLQQQRRFHATEAPHQGMGSGKRDGAGASVAGVLRGLAAKLASFGSRPASSPITGRATAHRDAVDEELDGGEGGLGDGGVGRGSRVHSHGQVRQRQERAPAGDGWSLEAHAPPTRRPAGGGSATTSTGRPRAGEGQASRRARLHSAIREEVRQYVQQVLAMQRAGEHAGMAVDGADEYRYDDHPPYLPSDGDLR
jgi:hypothetical protein